MPKQNDAKSVPILTQMALEGAREKLADTVSRINRIDENSPEYESVFVELEHWLDRVAVIQMDIGR